MRLEHGLHGLAQAEIGRAEDPGAEPRVAVPPGPAHRGDTVHELSLANRAHLLRPVGAVEGTALGEYRLHHVVAGSRYLLGHLLAEVHLLLPRRRQPAHVPQVVVWDR